MTTPSRSLDEQRREFSRSHFLAMPVAGTIAWTIIGIAGAFVPTGLASWILFICTGMIFGLGLILARFLGEDLIGKTRGNNEFDRLFFQSVLMAWLVFAIAIPFFMIEPTSLPLSVGILAGLMWLPFSWIINHWVGTFHAGDHRLVSVSGPAFCSDPRDYCGYLSDHDLRPGNQNPTCHGAELAGPGLIRYRRSPLVEGQDLQSRTVSLR
jgi:uncharacterized membrane protein